MTQKNEDDMILQNLKEATSEHHKEIEAISFSDKIMNSTLTFSEYEQLIIGNYIAHFFLEKLVRKAIPKDHPAEPQSREKLCLLLRDLETLGIPESGINMDFANALAPATATLPCALGYMYVLEGATLGGAIILKALAKNPQLATLPKYYYGCYGEMTGKQWKKFCEAVIASIQNGDEEKETIEGAKDAFSFFTRIFSEVNAGTCIMKD